MHSDTASGGDNKSRNEEAAKLIFDRGLKDVAFESDKESKFVSDLVFKFEEYGDRTFVSSKQIFWLRDLAERYL